VKVGIIILSHSIKRHLAARALAVALSHGVPSSAWKTWRKGREAERDFTMLAAPVTEARRILATLADASPPPNRKRR
jgi:hypothetical protein